MKSLFNKSKTMLLRIFFTNPDRAFYVHELGKILNKKPGIFHRALNQLENDGFLTSRFQANARYFKANPNHPLFPELKNIVFKTAGVEASLKSLFQTLKNAKAALIYGSFAKGLDRADSDIDILVIGEPLVENQLIRKLKKLENDLQREINFTLYSEEEYAEKRKVQDPFLEEVLNQKTILIKG
ncbi:MAG: nucleotidyltransferase domain-containing protein, partial [Elusimicrobia bacterium]|nr:nucleotidyltransferase domain-containing protein [Candidatus Obscuribacterium magneticum]